MSRQFNQLSWDASFVQPRRITVFEGILHHQKEIFPEVWDLPKEVNHIKE